MTKTLLVGAAVTSVLSSGCGGGGPTTGTTSGGGSTGGTGATSGSTGSTTGGLNTQYDTLSGTLTATGITATISGAIWGQDVGTTNWFAAPAFGTGSVSGPGATVQLSGSSVPAGSTGKLTVLLPEGGAAAAGTFTCSGSPAPTIEFIAGNNANPMLFAYTTTNSQPGESCTMTLQTPTQVASDQVFAHGSLTATLPGGGPAGAGTGTLSLTW